MKNLFKQVGVLAISIGMTLGVASVAQATFRVVQTPTYHLYSGESGAASTMRITPYPVDLDGTKLTMTDFGTTPTVTVDPKISNYEEIESFTGITDNGDNTATLTGVARDLASKYPYTTSGSGKTHGAGATVVFGNNPQVYGRLAALENGNTWTGLQVFNTVLPTSNLAATTSTQFVTKALLDASVNQGAATSTETNGGIVRLGTLTEQANSYNGLPKDPAVLQTKNATSSCQVAGSYAIIASSTTGKINGPCIDTAYSLAYTASTTYSARFTSSATTTIAASGTTSAPLILNGQAYRFPSTQSASSSVLQTDGVGSLSWGALSNIKYNYATSSIASAINGTNAFATSTAGINIPAGIMTGSSTVDLIAEVSAANNGSGVNKFCVAYLSDNTGTDIASTTLNTKDSTSGTTFYNLTYHTVLRGGLLTAQQTIANAIGIESPGTTPAYVDINNGGANSGVSSSLNFANAFTPVMVIKSSDATMTCKILNFTLTVSP